MGKTRWVLIGVGMAALLAVVSPTALSTHSHHGVDANGGYVQDQWTEFASAVQWQHLAVQDIEQEKAIEAHRARPSSIHRPRPPAPRNQPPRAHSAASGPAQPLTIATGNYCTTWRLPKFRFPLAVAHQCWDAALHQYAWPNFQKAFNVMFCESGGNPWAYNTSSATGLFQELHGPFDPAGNIALAWSMSNHGTNWRPWVCQ